MTFENTLNQLAPWPIRKKVLFGVLCYVSFLEKTKIHDPRIIDYYRTIGALCYESDFEEAAYGFEDQDNCYGHADELPDDLVSGIEKNVKSELEEASFQLYRIGWGDMFTGQSKEPTTSLMELLQVLRRNKAKAPAIDILSHLDFGSGHWGEVISKKEFDNSLAQFGETLK